MIERNHPALSIGAQCRLLSISRSSLYHEPAGETDQNLGLMRLIDRQFLDTPFYGVRQMTWHLQNEGHGVNQKRIRRLMRLMRLMPIYQKPDTSRPAKGHKTYQNSPCPVGTRIDRARGHRRRAHRRRVLRRQPEKARPFRRKDERSPLRLFPARLRTRLF